MSRPIAWSALALLFVVAAGCGGDDSTTETTPVEPVLTVAVVATPDEGQMPLEVEFDATVGLVNSEEPVVFAWTFGDDGTADIEDPTHVFTEPGTYTTTLVVTAGELEQSATVEIVVTPDTEPTVTATADPEVGISPLVVNFDCTAEGGEAPLAYQWSFGDGAVADSFSGSHTYTQNGEYNATCTVTDSDGDVVSDTVVIQVGADTRPIPTIIANPPVGGIPLDVTFGLNVSGGNGDLTYAWDFGDGNTSTDETPSHQFTEAGTYTASVVVTDEDGDTGVATTQIQVDDSLPTVTIIADPPTGGVPLDVNFSPLVRGGDGTLTYAWDFGDGNTSTDMEASHQFTAPGVYTVKLTVTDEDGDEGIGFTVVEVGDSMPDVSIVANPPAGGFPLDVTFEPIVNGGDGSLTYAWDFGDGNTSTDMAPTHQFTQAGSYTVKLTVTDEDGDEGVGTTIIRVDDSIPSVSISATPTTGHFPLDVTFDPLVQGGDGTLTYAWDFGDGNTSTDTSPTHQYTAPGAYTARVTVTDVDGDSASAAMVINVIDSLPNVTITANPTAGSTPLDVTFGSTVTGGDGTLSYEWNFGDGDTDNTPSPTHTYTAGGSFLATLTVTDADGDISVASTNIMVTIPNGAPVPVASASTNCAVPLQTEVQLDGSGTTDPDGDPLQYGWQLIRLPAGSNAGFNNPGALNPTFRPDQDGTYELRLFVSDGTSTVASDVITIVADGQTSSLIKTSADPADVAAGQLSSDLLSVRAQNSCGAFIEGKEVRWSGTNAVPRANMTYTDADGDTDNNFNAGTIAGPASVTASADNQSVDFNFNVIPGPPAVMLLDSVPQATVSDVTGVTITAQLADQFGNATTGPDLNFDLMVEGPPSAGFGAANGPMSVNLTTVNGNATTELYSTVVGFAAVRVTNSDYPLDSGSIRTVMEEDFEGDTSSWNLPGQNWQIGAPTSGPMAANSGANVLGTVLDGDVFLSQGTNFYNADLRLPGPDTPFPAMGSRVTISHWFDMTHPDSFCSEISGWVEGNYVTLYPESGYFNEPTCYYRDGFAGTTNGWVTTRFGLPGDVYDLSFVLYANGFSGQQSPGWYIDDIKVESFYQELAIEFLGGPADLVQVQSVTDGAADLVCSANATVTGTVTDAFGNPAADSTVDFALSAFAGIAEVVAASTGTLTSPPGPVGQFQTDGDAFSLEVFSDTAQTFDIAFTPVGSANTEIGNVTFGAPPADESMACGDGQDNDCDGTVDCRDSDCTFNRACEGETCEAAIPLEPMGPDYWVWNGDSCEFAPDGEVTGCSSFGGPDANFTFTAPTTGIYEICFRSPIPVNAELYNTTAGCPGALMLPSCGAAGCSMIPLDAGETYVGKVEWAECGFVGVELFGPPTSGCVDSCECQPFEYCDGISCVPAAPDSPDCQLVCDGDAFCDMVLPGSFCGPVGCESGPPLGCGGDSCFCSPDQICDPVLDACVPAGPDQCGLTCAPDLYCESVEGPGSACDPVSGTCFPGTGGCTDSCDCGGDQVCNFGVCQPATTDQCAQVCNPDLFCDAFFEPGSKCDGATGSCTPGTGGCTDSCECGDDQVCNFGICEPASPDQCDQVCSPDLFCDVFVQPGSTCDAASGSCLPSTLGCGGDSCACGPGMLCDPVSDACVPGDPRLCMEACDPDIFCEEVLGGPSFCDPGLMDCVPI